MPQLLSDRMLIERINKNKPRSVRITSNFNAQQCRQWPFYSYVPPIGAFLTLFYDVMTTTKYQSNRSGLPHCDPCLNEDCDQTWGDFLFTSRGGPILHNKPIKGFNLTTISHELQCRTLILFYLDDCDLQHPPDVVESFTVKPLNDYIGIIQGSDQSRVI